MTQNATAQTTPAATDSLQANNIGQGGGTSQAMQDIVLLNSGLMNNNAAYQQGINGNQANYFSTANNMANSLAGKIQGRESKLRPHQKPPADCR